MTGDPRMETKVRVNGTAPTGDDVHVDLVGREGFRMVLHAGTAPEITEDDRGYAHGTRRSHEEPTTPRRRGPTVGVQRRLLIAVGPTAGHVYPAVAIAEAYRARYPDLDVRFAGALDPLAMRLLGTHGYALEPVSASQLVNVGVGARLAGAGRVVAGVVQARRLLRAHRTRLVLGVGGYASGAILLAARTLGARVAIHEANVVPGLANRLLAPFAHRVYLGFAAAAPAFATRDPLVMGHPVRADIAALVGERRTPPDRDRPARVLVLSSTRGERFMANRVPDLLAAVERRGVAVEVLHQSGRLLADDVAHAYRLAGVKATVAPYLDAIASAYRWADFVVARSGAGTIAEIAAAGVPALLVPLPDAPGDHQAANAVAVASTGAGIVVREDAWRCDPLAAQVAALLGEAAWTAAAAASRSLARPDAAARIVDDCEALMTDRW
jgi:UDP-N-acetylglucosamine--N-acetylmuramyl-(pentapeptide) pyrophosphoryl-undecaprenol N-acetylglucosamine transferase